MSNTRIIRCSCAHKAQDETHGAGNRVHNECKGKARLGVWRCSVCETERGSAAKEEAKGAADGQK